MGDGGILSGDVGREDLDGNCEQARAIYHAFLRRCFDAAADCRGKTFRPRAVDGNPFKGYVPISFSITLIDLAGGMRPLRKWWEIET